MNTINKPSQNIAFHKAIRKLMRPIIRLALGRGISANDLFTWIKAIYVEEAEAFKIQGKKQSSSRIAVLTGLNRKEVAALRRLNQDVDQLLKQSSKKTNRAIRAVRAWQQQDMYTQDGEAIALPMYGEAPSFQSLIKEYCGDITLVSILGELNQADIISVDDNSVVHLRKDDYSLGDYNEEMLNQMGQAGYDLLNTATHNIQNIGDTSRLQWNIAYTNLNEDIASKLKKLVEQDSVNLAKKLDHWLNSEKALQEHIDNTSKPFRA